MSAPTNDCPQCRGAGWVWLHATAPGGAVQAVEASCRPVVARRRRMSWTGELRITGRRGRCRAGTAPG